MENADPLKELIESFSLPLPLPAEALLLNGKARRIPDFSLIFSQLPQVQDYVEMNATASGRQGRYLFQLIDGRFLFIQIEDLLITELGIVNSANSLPPQKTAPENSSSSILEVWKKGLEMKGH